MTNFAPKRTSYDRGDRRWARNFQHSDTHGVTVEAADVTRDANGLVKSGSLVAGEGLVVNEYTHRAGERHMIAVMHAGTVDRRHLPAALTAAQEASLKGIVFINGNAPA